MAPLTVMPLLWSEVMPDISPDIVIGVDNEPVFPSPAL